MTKPNLFPLLQTHFIACPNMRRAATAMLREQVAKNLFSSLWFWKTEDDDAIKVSEFPLYPNNIDIASMAMIISKACLQEIPPDVLDNDCLKFKRDIISSLHKKEYIAPVLDSINDAFNNQEITDIIVIMTKYSKGKNPKDRHEVTVSNLNTSNEGRSTFFREAVAYCEDYISKITDPHVLNYMEFMRQEMKDFKPHTIN